jgi:uncharacterized caspase-like protein
MKWILLSIALFPFLLQPSAASDRVQITGGERNADRGSEADVRRDLTLTISPPPSHDSGDATTPRPVSQSLPRPNALAIVIGNRAYTEAPHVNFAHNDAEAFARLFTEVMGLEPRKVILETDLTSIGMRRLFGPVGREGDIHNFARFADEIFVFYSGHGVPEIRSDGSPRAYLLPVDVPPGAPWLGAYALDDLFAQLESLPVERVTIFLDTCFSGLSQSGSLVPNVSGAFGVSVAPPPRQARVSVLAATDFEEPQFAHWLTDREHGAFTWYALEGLRGAADPSGQGRVRLSDLRNFIDEGLTFNRIRQRPSLRQGGEDKVIVEFELPIPAPVDALQEPAVREVLLAARPMLDQEQPKSVDNMEGPEALSFEFKSLTRSELRRIQAGLDLMGFSPGSFDGVFGPRTEHAIRAWLREQDGRTGDLISFADVEYLKASLAAIDGEIAQLIARLAVRSSDRPDHGRPQNIKNDCIWFQGECR